MKKRIMRFGWKRDLPDHRDVQFKITAPITLPKLVDLRLSCPPIYDQGDLGSCTANALAGAFEFEQMKQKEKYFIPSRLFIYYNERSIEGTINSDSGAAIRDGIKTLVKDGVCPESLWKYKINKFRKKPCRSCYRKALKNQVLEYLSITHSITDIKQCLALGYPVVFGFTVYELFMSEEVAKTGIAPIPQPNESAEGGHAIMCVGYDDTKNALIIRNSWGTGWGLNGYFYMPYEYITRPNLAADFWTIRLVE
jgi:C1A family cysteine protease